METILKNTENSKASVARRFRLNLCVKIDLETPNNNIPLANRSIAYIMHDKTSEHLKFQISSLSWNDEFELLDRSNRS